MANSSARCIKTSSIWWSCFVIAYTCKDCEAMKNSKALFQDFLRQLTMEENPDEIQAIGYLVFEKVLGVDRTMMMTGRELLVSSDDLRQLEEIAQRLNAH